MKAMCPSNQLFSTSSGAAAVSRRPVRLTFISARNPMIRDALTRALGLAWKGQFGTAEPPGRNAQGKFGTERGAMVRSYALTTRRHGGEQSRLSSETSLERKASRSRSHSSAKTQHRARADAPNASAVRFWAPSEQKNEPGGRIGSERRYCRSRIVRSARRVQAREGWYTLVVS